MLVSVFLIVIGVVTSNATTWGDLILSVLPGVLLFGAVMAAARYRQKNPEPMD